MYLLQEPLSNDIHSRMEAIEEIMDNLHIDSPGCQVTYFVSNCRLRDAEKMLLLGFNKETSPEPLTQYLIIFKSELQFVEQT